MTTHSNESDTSASNPISVLGEALEAAASSVHDARADASASAKVAAVKVQSGLSKGAYYAAYGVSYGVVFTGVFAKELLPEGSSVRRGFEQGVNDGAQAAIGAAAKIHTLQDQEDDEFVEHEAADEPAS
jgi:hypothetical protein